MLSGESGFTDAIADFGDDRRDVYKVYVRAGETLRVRTEGAAAGRQSRARRRGLLAWHARSREPGNGVPLTSTRASSSTQLAALRNYTPNGRLLPIQVTARRGWGAYRLRWSVGPASRRAQASARRAARRAVRRAGRAPAGRRRPCAVARRAATIAPGADERVLADLDARQQDRRPADARAAPDHRALHERAPALGAAHEVVVRRDHAGRDEDVVLELAVGRHVGLGLDADALADAACRSRRSHRGRRRSRGRC